ncbi:MAG: S-adenosylmethionine:tRNA ribosyltransferase-isomerase [Muribaculaceae bacterium]|nr:S-adenosylmethionine:tRNA ribosyltransferase-isomerase [Muribaculaceae bacterium]
MVKDIRIDDYDYALPEEKIALHPLEERDQCKLLLKSPEGKIYHRIFKELPDLIPPGALLICNDTKVINARLAFHKLSGAQIELFLLEPVEPSDYALNFQSRQDCKWKCLVGNSKKWKEGEIQAEVKDDEEVVRIKAMRESISEDGSSVITFYWSNPHYTFGKILELVGKIPIPPYLNRESEDSDLEDYQTVYAHVKGSVAAPTAGLHFTPQVFEGLDAHGVKVGKVTLHVGAGTFRPVKSDRIGEHAMHAEPFTVTKELLEQLMEWKSKGQPVVAVGTTSVRTLESLPYIGRNIEKGVSNPWIVNQWDAYTGEEFDTIEALKRIIDKLNEDKTESLTASTSIMIAPGFQWRITDCMVTNFHQPKSTLLLLVSSFLGNDSWKSMYQEALKSGYRFLSYGDACLLLH